MKAESYLAVITYALPSDNKSTALSHCINPGVWEGLYHIYHADNVTLHPFHPNIAHPNIA